MSVGLPVNLIITVNVNQAPPPASFPNVNSLLIAGDSGIIDTNERIRSYSDLDTIGLDFGTDSPEYLAAQKYLAQAPQPQTVMIGAWAAAATAGEVLGDVLSDTEQAMANFTAITTGAFLIFVNGTPYAISGVNLSSQTNLNGVAAQIQAALRLAAGGTPTVVWNSVYSRFEIASGTTGVLSSISYAKPPSAVGAFLFTTIPLDGATITIGGSVFTFKTVVTLPATQIPLGVDLPTTLANTVAFLNASTDVKAVLSDYTLVGNNIYAVANAPGTAGNTITLAVSTTFATVSAGTMLGGTGVDLSSLMGVDSTGRAVSGSAVEAPLDAVVALDSLGLYWYGLTFASTTPISNTQHLAIADYIEAASNRHTYGITSPDPECMDGTSTNDIAAQVEAGRYNRTFVQYSSTTSYAAASFYGRALTVDFTQNNSVITLMFKNEPTVQAETIGTNAALALKAKNCNVFVNYNNNTAIIQYGTMGSGVFFDSVYNADSFGYSLQAAAYDLLYSSPTKIPQTDAGNNQLAGVMEGVCDQFVSDGYLAPGTWTVGGVGQIAQGQFLPKGYYIYTPPIAAQMPIDRAARKSVPFQILAKEAGAIHSANITVLVNR